MEARLRLSLRFIDMVWNDDDDDDDIVRYVRT